MKDRITGKLGMARKAREYRRAAWLWSAALPFCAALGCDAQAGPDYTGESLLALRGTVVLSEASASGLVPALAFVNYPKVALLDGQVQGKFPAQFQLDVTEPPPPEARMSSLKGAQLIDGTSLDEVPGLGAGAAFTSQSFETEGVAPDRLSASPLTYAGARLQRELSPRWFIALELRGEEHLVDIQERSGQDPELQLAFAARFGALAGAQF